jgi:Ca2+-binding EF-hand superfamily protein
MAVPLILIVAAAAAQAPAAIPADRPHFGGRAFMSPMGEPFFGRRPGEDGLTAWFEQADRNRDGILTANELAQDAQRFFLTLDSNHDGEIDPDEITHYEEVIAPEIRAGPMRMAAGAMTDSGEQRGGGGHGGHRGGGGGGGGGGGHRGGGGGERHRAEGGSWSGGGFDDEASAGRFGLLQIPEPVASADTNFNRGVSADEFQQAAASRFQLLDTNRTGRLTLSQLQGIRQAAASASRHPQQQKVETEQQAPPDDSGGPPMQVGG